MMKRSQGARDALAAFLADMHDAFCILAHKHKTVIQRTANEAIQFLKEVQQFHVGIVAQEKLQEERTCAVIQE